MNPGKIAGANRGMTKPVGWDEARHGPCATLPVLDTGETLQSAWFPSPEEIAAIQQGCPVILNVWGQRQPVVAIGVAPTPDAAEQMCFHGNTVRSGCSLCAAEDAGIDARLVVPSDFGKNQPQ